MILVIEVDNFQSLLFRIWSIDFDNLGAFNIITFVIEGDHEESYTISEPQILLILVSFEYLLLTVKDYFDSIVLTNYEKFGYLAKRRTQWVVSVKNLVFDQIFLPI